MVAGYQKTFGSLHFRGILNRVQRFYTGEFDNFDTDVHKWRCRKGMRKVKILAFGITREIIGRRELEIPLNDGYTVADLRSHLASSYPGVLGLKSLFIAVNNEYAADGQVLNEADEIAIIPPVSGG